MIKKGFTLSEVLISLAIIAIVATLILPMAQRQLPNRNIVMFKKAYNVLLQSVANLASDDGNYPAGQPGTDNNSAQVERGFNYTTATGNVVGANTYNKFCYYFFDQFNITSGGSTSCPLASGTSATAANVALTKTITSDGVTWYMYIPYNDASVATTYVPATSATTAWPLHSGLYNTKIIIDVSNGNSSTNCTQDTNGANFLPTGYTVGTSTTCPNPDTFIVGVRYDGKVQVGCTANSGVVCSTATDSNANNILQNPTTNN